MYPHITDIKSSLQQHGKLHLRCYGSSMLPAILPGDELSFLPMRSSTGLAIGNIVVLHRERRVFVHRLVSRTATGWITRGDSLQQDDPPLFDADILGVLVAQFRNGNPIPLRPLQQTRWAKLTRWLAARSSLMRKAILHWPNFCLRLS